MAIFLIYSGAPVYLYFSYIFFGDILKKTGFNAESVINQNFYVSIAEFLAMGFIVFLSYRIHPLKIIKFKALLFLPFLITIPFLLNMTQNPSFIFLIQLISVCLTIGPIPASAIFMSHMPIFRRFTYASILYALSRALMAIITSFGLVYLTDFFGYWGLYFSMIPIIFGFLWGVSHFEKLEHISKN